MKIYLLRHGDAVQNSLSDSLRPLSENGVQEIKKIGEFLKLRNIIIQKIYSSPLLRAYQSATIVSQEINYTGDIVELDILLPEGNPADVLNYLTKIEYQSVLLVTHQPLIGNLVSSLIFGRNYPIGIKKSTLVSIESGRDFDSKNVIMNYLINPEIL